MPPRRGAASRRALVLVALTALTAWAAGAPEAAAQCLDCHADADFLASVLPDPARPVAPLVVDEALFGRSVHGGMDCADCHMGFDETPHVGEGMSFDCTGCHADQVEALSGSVHGSALDGEPVSCTACHGVHDVLPPTDRASRLNPLNVYKACGQCHFEADPATSSIDQLLREPYTDDAHARGLLRGGLAVAATCVSCHGGHEIKASGDAASPVSRLHVQDTCGTCHVGVLEQYQESVHAVRNHDGEHQGATCSDCHPPHTVTQADDDFRAQTVATCGGCHPQRFGSFGLSYHGKATGLGFRGKIATCSSCHGNHAIFDETDPRSSVHPANLVATCSQCHEDAHAAFASFDVHADPTDPDRDPTLHAVWQFMRWLLVVVLILGLTHVGLWLYRTIAAGQFRRRYRHKRSGRYVRRWPRAFVVFHVWMMSTVLLLACTGMPLHYSSEGWASGLMRIFGGPPIAAWVHRVGAVSLAALGATYVVYILWRALVKRERGLLFGPDSMVPRYRDVTDFLGMLRWFLGRGPQPRFDRWTYWEKFDFWAAGWGLFVIGMSGLILWFPEQATRIVPPWFVSAAVVIHGIEALLDIAFIFTVHAFHANLRPDKFPMDIVYLTGRIPEEEFLAERPDEYARVTTSGAYEAMLADRPTRRLRVAAYVLGFAAMGIGFFFVIMMAVAVLTR